jgi:8-oxo-dGTP pyrophosphatase MutT (NUDIX family)
VEKEGTISRLKSILEPCSSLKTIKYPSDLIPAGVLVTLVSRKDTLNLLFTQRAQTLKRHPGEICFPGGKFDKDDENILATALREAQEEIGLNPDQVTVLGIASEYISASGFIITPVVGHVLEPFCVKPCESEISEVFEVELEYFLDISRFSYIIKTDRQKVRKSYRIEVGNKLIHGITAGIIYDISQRFQQIS